MSYRILFVSFLIGSLVSMAGATTYVVRPDGSGDFPTVQAAIDGSGWGVIIELAPGVYTGDGNRDIQPPAAQIRIRGQGDDPTACIIDCEGSEADPHRGFIFGASAGPGPIIENLTIRGGYATGEDPPDLASCGGGIVIHEGASPSFVDVIVRGCTAEDGGGVAIGQNARPSFLRCTFADNVGWWGAGGGAWSFYATPSFVDCTFEGNSTNQIGAGLICYGPDDAVITGCRFLNNGGISQFAAGVGLAISGGRAAITGCVFAGNVGYEGGGLLLSSTPMTSVSGCTVYGNTAVNGAGIMAEWGAVVTVDRTIMAGNLDGSAAHCDGGFLNLSCCDVWGNEGGDWTDCIAGYAGTAGNISLDPLFCDAAGGDLTLDVHSPCAPAQNPGCGLVGALPVGCNVTGVVEPDPRLGSLLSVAPNPMSGSCQIALRPVVARTFTLEVLDVTGRVVRRLHAAPVAAAKDGGLSLAWDGCDESGRAVASGIYWLRASSSARTESRRIVMIR